TARSVDLALAEQAKGQPFHGRHHLLQYAKVTDQSQRHIVPTHLLRLLSGRIAFLEAYAHYTPPGAVESESGRARYTGSGCRHTRTGAQKDEDAMADDGLRLITFYSGWENYQNLLTTAVAPLTAEQLELQAAQSLRPVWLLAAHIISARAYWFHAVLGEG